MNNYQNILKELESKEYVWLVTGVAGFIGSNILEKLLSANQRVIGIDNLETGFMANLDDVRSCVSVKQWSQFTFHEKDIRNFEQILPLFQSVDYVLHQAALGSVPRSIRDPLRTNEVNISGFLNVIQGAKIHEVEGFVYAASSSTYGDHIALPKKEEIIGNPLSPYAITKYANELYAKIYSQHYGIKTVGLRYFNVFGKRQDPDGAYSAVIPKWAGAMTRGEDIFVNGDGSTTRDFCYIDNAVQANIMAALHMKNWDKPSNVFNIAFGASNSLKILFQLISSILEREGCPYSQQPIFRDFRQGDIKDSLADISKARDMIGYNPSHDLQQGLNEYLSWFVSRTLRND